MLDRRKFLRRLLGALSGLFAMALDACDEARTGISSIDESNAPGNSVESRNLRRTVQVKSYGARGDGRTDDTEAFRKAIDALGTNGGVVEVGSGVYLIDAGRGVQLRSNLTLMLAADSIIRAIPNKLAHYAVLKATNETNIKVIGGAIEGERWSHLGTTGESGYGIELRGCTAVEVRDVAIRDCWGDGVFIWKGTAPSKQITIIGCTIDGNRRQGISVVDCLSALITNCLITNTGGTEPHSGIDLEPGTGSTVENVRIQNCRIVSNYGCGIQMVAFEGAVRNNVIEDPDCERNGRAAVRLIGATANEFRGNRFKFNAGHGIWCEGRATQNVFAVNACDSNGSGGNTVYDNIYVDTGSNENRFESNVCRAGNQQNRPRYGIRINAASCTANSLIKNDVANSGSLGDISDAGTGTIIVR